MFKSYIVVVVDVVAVFVIVRMVQPNIDVDLTLMNDDVEGSCATRGQKTWFNLILLFLLTLISMLMF